MTSSASNNLRVSVTKAGELLFVYDDALRPLMELGSSAVRRASHVEPVAGQGWSVDLSPIGGPALPLIFDLRADALAAERAYLESPAGVALLVAAATDPPKLEEPLTW